MFARRALYRRPSPPKRPPRLGRWLLGLGLAMMLIMGGAAFIGVSYVQRLRALLIEVHDLYRDLEMRWAFEPPASDGPAPSERLDAYLRARRALLAPIDPRDDARAEGLLASRQISSLRLVPFLYAFAPRVRVAARAHAEALAREQMSPREYLWLHGWAVASLWETAPETESVREFARLEHRLEPRRTEGRPHGPIQDRLRAAYAEFPPVERGRLADFDAGGTLGRLTDLLAADPHRAADILKAIASGGPQTAGARRETAAP